MYSLIVENIKCIIAAGGLGTRLQDFRGNKSTKILLDVKGTSMINRQISQLYKWGLRKFVIITNPEYLDMVKEDTLNKFDNLNIDFTVQEEPKGISHALYQARDYVDLNEKIFFVLGDNFFENNPFNNFHLDKFEEGACIFTTEVSNPEEFGVAEIDGDGKVLSIEEKPHHPKSNAAVVGIYIFDDTVFKKIETLEPSARGEYEVTDLCNIYVNENKCLNLDLNGWWIDAGTPDRIIELEEKAKKINFSEEARIKVKSELHYNDDVTKTSWDKTGHISRKCYLVTSAPGTESEKPTSGLESKFDNFDFSKEESEKGYENFCVIKCKIKSIEWLYLAARGHRRALIEFKKPKKFTWLVP